jgi:undecaprenyl-diphosphatase
MFSLMQNIHDLDIRLLKAIYENRDPFFDLTFIAITNSAAVIAFGVPLILLILAVKRKNIVLRREALTILLSVAISAIAANLLKYAVDLPRPFEIYPFIVKLSSGGSPSFPSGHTADAFAFAVALGLVYRKWYFYIPCLVWASLVGYSRMNLGVHFPSDVLAGAIIGIVSAFAFIAFMKRKQAVKE